MKTLRDAAETRSKQRNTYFKNNDTKLITKLRLVILNGDVPEAPPTPALAPGIV